MIEHPQHRSSDSVPQTPSEQSALLLARSAFGFAFAALIPAAIVLVALLLSPVSPDAGFAQFRQIILIGYSVLFVILAFVCWRWFRIPPERLVIPARHAARLLMTRWIVLLILVLLAEANFFAFIALAEIAPAITGPGKFLLVCWTLIIVGIIVTVNLPALSNWFPRTRGFWTGAGIAATIAVIGLILYGLNLTLIEGSGLSDRLRGTFDYRVLTFFGGEVDPVRSRDYLAEAGDVRARWTPYVYWTMAPRTGQYINIDENGLRHTANFVEKDDPQAQQIFFFGGSTGWGEGARDDYTIPSQMARLLHENGVSAYVTSYAQPAFVSTQDLILFQLQLALGHIPDVAVFYHGFNEILTTYQGGAAGLPYNEFNRAKEFYAGRWLADGHPVLRAPDISADDIEIALISEPGISAESIVERYLGNLRLLRTIADEYGVKIILVWQPAIIHKKALTANEQIFREKLDAESPGFAQLYQETDALLRQHVARDTIPDILMISDLFKDEPGYIFFDQVHITEDGNYAVAQAIIPSLVDLLSKDKP